MYYLQKKEYVQCPADMTRHSVSFVAALEYTGHVRRHSFTLLPAAMASTTNGKRSASDVAAAAKRRRGKRNLPTVQEEQQLPPNAYSDICTYWTANPAFDSQGVLLRRLFFLNASKTKYVSVGFTPPVTISLWWNSVSYGAADPRPPF